MSWFNEKQHERLGALADVLIPEAEGMPSATSVGAAGPLLLQALNARPDLAPEILRVLRSIRDFPPCEALEVMRVSDMEGFSALTLAIASAYYMAPEVRELLGYDGPRRIPAEVTPENINDLLAPVIARGPIWRQPLTALSQVPRICIPEDRIPPT